MTGDQLLSQPIRQAQRDTLQNVDQHIVIEGAMKRRQSWHCRVSTLVECNSRGVAVHGGAIMNSLYIRISLVQISGPRSNS